MQAYHIVKNIFSQCVEDRCPQIAASLAYVTILALIPLTVLIYKVFSGVFVNPALQIKTQAFIFDSLSPAAAKDIQQYLLESATQASALDVFGIFVLLLSVMAMMNTIDRALNSIWKIKSSRYFIRRVLVYLALLIFGPLAISFALFVSTYIASFHLIAALFGESVNNGLVNGLPFIVLWIAFTMLYKWIPDCPVKWQYAFVGATFAVCLFEITKMAFTYYVSNFSSYELLYGALAAIPLLLIWIYLIWLIVLMGAEIAYFLGVRDSSVLNNL